MFNLFKRFNKKVMEEESNVIDVEATEPVEEVLPVVNGSEFSVYDSSGVFLRTYTTEIHGDKAHELAEQFASQYQGAVIK